MIGYVRLAKGYYSTTLDPTGAWHATALTRLSVVPEGDDSHPDPLALQCDLDAAMVTFVGDWLKAHGCRVKWAQDVPQVVALGLGTMPEA